MKEAYRNTEHILYAYNTLNQKLAIDIQDILDLKAEHERYNTSHKKTRPEDWDADIDDEIRHTQKIRNRERGMVRTQKLIERIKHALSILDAKEYELIAELYFDGLSVTEVAQTHGCSVKTVCKNRKRIVTDMMILLYGADALE